MIPSSNDINPLSHCTCVWQRVGVGCLGDARRILNFIILFGHNTTVDVFGSEHFYIIASPRSRLRKFRNVHLRPMAHSRFQDKGADVAAANLSYGQGRPLCVNGTPWILYLLDECVQNMSEYWSVVIGLISMFCFLLSTVPQVYEAYRNGKVEEAMSFGFLLFLISGDLSSLMGCYLTNQLPIQIITGVFYIFTDMSLISQFLYYKIKNSSSKSIPSHWFSALSISCQCMCQDFPLYSSLAT